MSEWKLKVTCPEGHSDNIVMFYTGHEFMLSCAKCDNNQWWEPTDKEFKANGVTVS